MHQAGTGESILDSLVITRLLQEWVNTGTKFSVHLLDGRYLGAGVLSESDNGKLALRFHQFTPEAAKSGRIDVKLSAAVSQGEYSFMLQLDPAEFVDLWRGPCPIEILRVQARRHRRIRSIRGPDYHAWLLFPGAPGTLTLIDLSEEGAECEVTGAVLPPVWKVTGGQLMLDDFKVQVQAIQPIRCIKTGFNTWRVGVTLRGISADAMRTFRRWLDAAETRSISMERIDQR